MTMKKPIKRKAAKASERLSDTDILKITVAAENGTDLVIYKDVTRRVIRAYRAFMRKRG